ncbi:hypothetical protein DICSQDRAFT_153257 [Dichomitus squalens LYAD-421 SS1]|uniref:uncharacterized protein n=1 Tax=Dichomitus squalens (strain LYAD-421) TaxID=732165 RepID=UPI00044121A3|nr:uncharacterized protein DICSQDRAFT_153257 [Dichomitus squalens LYAD-421 SS1]EJF64149.1 hypothetical protein DICSQDRAFT_153257 [Dichomitus squalens LYAD-421 SS1]
MSQYQQYYLFSLPRELLDTLVPRNILSQVPEPVPPPRIESSAQQAPGSRACNICLGAAFVDVEDQRAHFRSDWHRYNVKVRLNGADPVTEQHFAQLVDGLEDSISGSASSSDGEDSSDGDDAVAALVQKTRKLARPSSPDETARTIPQIPLVWFHSPPATQIGIYRTVFSTSTPPPEYLSELKQMQSGGEHGRTWALFMTAGGHFAGAIVRVKRPDGDDDDGGLTKKGKPRRPKPELEVLKHKTFHRYTTRRKQGGSQSLNDNAKSKAVSAGAMLRRYGEQALRDDIRNLLADWAEDIYDCERIFIRASVSNRRIFLDYEGAVIEKGDERLRGFPFPTRRPTQAELTRCLQELTRVKVSHLTEDALRAQDEALLASLPKPKPQPTPAPHPEAAKHKDKPAASQLSPEEELLRDKWARLLDMVKRGRLDALKPFWAREAAALGGVDAAVPEWAAESGGGGTLLQVAARAGQAEVAQWLLEDLRADPTLAVPAPSPGTGASAAADDSGSGAESDSSDAPRLPRGRGGRRTAYDLARTKEVRNVFRRAAAAHPDWWDWLGTERGARVPSVLSAEMEEGREGKKKARRKGLKDKVKEREVREREREAATPSPPPPPVQEARRQREELSNGGPRRLGGSTGGAESVAGLTPEMRAKIERERRARAAEARLRALGGGR